MSDAHKPFAPTPNRIARAKREGQRARSSEVCGVAAFACALLGVALAAPMVFAQAGAALHNAAHATATAAAASASACVVALALVPLACAACGAFAAGAIDGGVSVSAPTFSAQRIDPAAGLRRLFSRDSALTALRAGCAFGAALAAVVAIAPEAFAAALERSSPEALAASAAGIALRSCVTVAAVGIVFAALDRWSAQRRWLRGLRMTHEELKRDLRESEGDPHAKGRRASMHRALVRGSIARVREASFVVANPQHIAVALKYDPPQIPVPEILVRACDDAAQRVKAIAREHGVPVVENVALARALFAGGEAGAPIPRSLYLAVAQLVLALAREGLAT